VAAAAATVTVAAVAGLKAEASGLRIVVFVVEDTFYLSVTLRRSAQHSYAGASSRDVLLRTLVGGK